MCQLTSSSVSSVRAACRILDRAICTRQSSLLLRRPYSPTSFSSPSRRSFSKGRLGFLKVLPSAKNPTCQLSQQAKNIAGKSIVQQQCSQADAASNSKVAKAREREKGTYSCGSRIREASCFDAYCLIQTGKRLNVAQRDLLTAGG